MFEDDRGAVTIARFFLALVVGAFVFWIVDAVASPLLTHANGVESDAAGAQATQWLEFGIGYLPVIFLGIAFFGIIAYSIAERALVG